MLWYHLLLGSLHGIVGNRASRRRKKSIFGTEMLPNGQERSMYPHTRAALIPSHRRDEKRHLLFWVFFPPACIKEKAHLWQICVSLIARDPSQSTPSAPRPTQRKSLTFWSSQQTTPRYMQTWWDCKMLTLTIITQPPSYPNAQSTFSLPGLSPPKSSHGHTSKMHAWFSWLNITSIKRTVWFVVTLALSWTGPRNKRRPNDAGSAAGENSGRVQEGIKTDVGRRKREKKTKQEFKTSLVTSAVFLTT